MSPIIRPSLWMPLTRWNSTSGFAAPSQSTRPASRSQRRASRGSAQMISATPHRARTRWAYTPWITSEPVSAVMPRPSIRNSGPYGAGVSRQIVGIVRVSGSSTPNAAAGPSEYGSRPRAVIALCAR